MRKSRFGALAIVGIAALALTACNRGTPKAAPREGERTPDEPARVHGAVDVSRKCSDPLDRR